MLLEDKVASLDESVTNLKKIIELKDYSMGICGVENKRLFELWKKENKLRHEAENRPRFGSWLSWGIAGGATIAAVVMFGIVVSD